MVFFDVIGLGVAGELFILKLKEDGVFALANAEYKVRMVMRRGIEGEHMEKALVAVESVADEVCFTAK
jgi:hypothetical protein